MPDRHTALHRAFNPRRMAVVGVSGDRSKWSNILFRRLLNGPFDGEVIAVNPTRDQIEGAPCYPSVCDIPGDIDYAQILVPHAQTAATLADCAAKGVGVAHVLASGFGEVAGGDALQADLVNALNGGPTVMIGPNSLGLYSASAGLDFAEGASFAPSDITFISQSGALCTDVQAQAQARGIAFGKILSVGNCADLDWPDFAAFARDDPGTGAVVFYIESVRDGRALYEQLEALARVKPVMLLKGGRTASGAQSVVSHTGRLAGEYAVWQAMMVQAGVVELTGLEDMLAALAALQAHRRARAYGGAMVVGCGGGISVVTGDALAEAGVNIAPLTAQTRDDLHALLPDAAQLGGIGAQIEMPVDRMFADTAQLRGILQRIGGDAGVGSVLVHLNLIAFANQFGTDNFPHHTATLGAIADAAGRIGKPVILWLRNGDVGPVTQALARHGAAWAAGQDRVACVTSGVEVVAFLRHLQRFQGGGA